MADRWILNASPVIVLARTGLAHLFNTVADTACIPEAVAAEIQAGPADDVARRWLASGAVPVVETPSPTAQLVAWDLGAGETAVLAYAMATPGWVAVLDDAAARRCARSFSIPLLGTLAIVVRAKQRGAINSAAQALQALVAAGFGSIINLLRWC